jgi:hypothetical protein
MSLRATALRVGQATFPPQERLLQRTATNNTNGSLMDSNVSAPELLTAPYSVTEVIEFNLPLAGTNSGARGNIGLRLDVLPVPIAGAGLPGLILASGGLLGWWRRRAKDSLSLRHRPHAPFEAALRLLNSRDL